MENKSRFSAAALNFFLPGLGLAYLAGGRWAVFGLLSWLSLMCFQFGALAVLASEFAVGIGIWLGLAILHSISAAVLAAAIAKK